MMIRAFIGIYLVLIVTPAISAEIECYAASTRIYHGKVSDLNYYDQFLEFSDEKNTYLTNSECFITAPRNKK